MLMLKFFEKTKAAVSVFLVLILVPMIVITSVFVDSSKLELSKSVVTSAGDLTLNTVLSQYDKELNDYFGMLASAQNIDEFLGVVDEYFKASLVSQGVETTDIDAYIAQLNSLFTEGEQEVDFLGIKESNFSVTKVQNGAMVNPAIIKAEIVDFMKYRSPINAAAELLNALTSGKERLDVLDEVTEMENKKNDFYEKERDLLEDALEIYKKIDAYQNLGITKTYIENSKQNIGKYKDDYERVHKKYVYDMCNTSGATVFNVGNIKKTPTKNTYSSSVLCSNVNMGIYLYNVAVCVHNYSIYKSSFENALNAISDTSDNYNTQYWIHMADVFKQNNLYNNYVNSANDLFEAYETYKNARDHCEAGVLDGTFDLDVFSGVNTSGTKTILQHGVVLEQQVENIKNNDFSNTGNYYTISNKLHNISEVACNNQNNNLNTDGTIHNTCVDTTITSIHTEINDYYKKYDEGLTKLGTIASDLNSLKTKADACRTAYQSWNSAAFSSSLDGEVGIEEDENNHSTNRTNFGAVQSDRYELENNRDLAKFLDEVNSEKIQNLIERINNIKSLLGTAKSSIESIKYNNKKILDISNFNDFKNASKAKANEIGITKTELSNYAASTFSFEQNISFHNVTNNNNPNLNENSPEFYTWLKNKFDGYEDKEAEKNEAEDRFDDIQDMATQNDSNQETGTPSPHEIKDLSNLPSNSNSGDDDVTKTSTLTAVSNFVSNLFSDFSGTALQGARNVRDDLYITDYITSMFSFDTFEQEAKYAMALDDEKDVDLLNCASIYAEYDDDWESTDLTKTYNKSLTNKMINDENCYAFSNEVEYILYGGSNSANLIKAYASIYMLRFAFNIFPVFAKYYNDDFVLTIAQTISAATMGIIPVPLVQIAVCIALCAIESGIDIAYIKNGIGVKLIKAKDELFLSFNSGSDNMSFTTQEKDSSSVSNDVTGNSGLCFQYSDYLKIFLFLKQLNDSKADQIYLRTADVIQANMNHMKHDNVSEFDYKLSNSQVYFKLKSDIEVKPLMFGLPITADSISKYDISGWNTYTYSAIRGY